MRWWWRYLCTTLFWNQKESALFQDRFQSFKLGTWNSQDFWSRRFRWKWPVVRYKDVFADTLPAHDFRFLANPHKNGEVTGGVSDLELPIQVGFKRFARLKGQIRMVTFQGCYISTWQVTFRSLRIILGQYGLLKRPFLFILEMMGMWTLPKKDIQIFCKKNWYKMTLKITEQGTTNVPKPHIKCISMQPSG